MSFLLKEDGDRLLLESGDSILLDEIPPVPTPKRIRHELPEVVCTIDDKAVALRDDWLASSVVNGGYNVASLSIPSREAGLHVAQDAPVRLFVKDGGVVYEGVMEADPRLDDGIAFLKAIGHKEIVEGSIGRRMYQAFGPGVWANDGGAPFAGTPSASISASIEPGGLRLEAAQGQTVNQDDETLFPCWIPGTKIRRIRATGVVNGNDSDYEMRIYKCTGPDGARTHVATPSATMDETITAPTDMILVGLRRTGVNHTRTDTLSVLLKNIRVNDLRLEDSLTASAIASDLGRRNGLDVSGVPDTQGTDTVTGGFAYTYYTGVPGDYLFPRTGFAQTAVAISVLNVMPIDHQGSDAALLDYLAMLLDWRWTIGANRGQGPLLNFGPWGPEWDIMLDAGAKAEFVPQRRYDAVVVHYRNASGKPSHHTQFAAVRNKRSRSIAVTLQDPQKNDLLARRVAELLLERSNVPRFSARIDAKTAFTADGRNAPYELMAGSTVRVGDWGPADAQEFRVASVEMNKGGIVLGVDQPLDIDSLVAWQQQRSIHKVLGHVHTIRRVGDVITYEM